MNTCRHSRSASMLKCLLLANVFAIGWSWYAPFSHLKVHLPLSLRLDNGESYDHREALFGEQPSGGSITAPLFFADSTLCNDDMSLKSKPIQFYPYSPLSADLPGPFILMINRGGCHFVQKVRNAQHMGAAGVLIADNLCLCSDDKCQGEPGKECESAEPNMADDGSGSDVKIPSFLLFKRDADAFKKNIMDNKQPMRVEMSFSYTPKTTPTETKDDASSSTEVETSSATTETTTITTLSSDTKMSNSITMDFWVTPADYHSRNFLLQFHPLVDAFQSCINFEPHMYLVNGVQSGCLGKSNDVPDSTNKNNKNNDEDPNSIEQDETPQDLEANSRDLPCYNLCTNGGRYCAGDPDGEFNRGLSGTDVVTESLRQLCIWSNYDSTPLSNRMENGNQKNQWWDYAREYTTKCSHIDDMDVYEKCIDDIIQELGMNRDLIERCMTDSGGLSRYGTNNKLEQEIALQQRENIYVVPTLRFNHRTFDGTMNELFDHMCQSCGYQNGRNERNAPASVENVCSSCTACPDIMGCVARGGVCAPLSSSWSSSSSSSSSSLSSSSSTSSTETTHHHKTSWYDHSSASKTKSNHHETKTNVKRKNMNDMGYENDEGVSVTTFFSSVILVSMAMFLTAYWYHKRTKEQSREQIRAIMVDYMPLHDNDVELSGSP